MRRVGRLHDEVVVVEDPPERADAGRQRAPGGDANPEQRARDVRLRRREERRGDPDPRRDLCSAAPADVAAAVLHPARQGASAALAERVRRDLRVAVRDEEHVDVVERARLDVTRRDRRVRETPHALEQVAQPALGLAGGRARRRPEHGHRRAIGRKRRRRRLRERRDELRNGREDGAGASACDVEEQRVAPARDVVEVGERDVRVLVQERLDPVLLRLRHRHPVRAGRQHARRRRCGRTA